MTPEFNRWWDADELMQTNPYPEDTPVWWAWEGWQAARAESAKEIADLKAQVDALTRENTEVLRLIEDRDNQLDDLRVQVDGLESALDQIRSWCRAYPISVFTEPDWNDVREKLGDILLTRVSGSNMRHVVEGVQKIINAAIAQEKQND